MIFSPLIGVILSFYDKKLSYDGRKWILILFITIFGSTLSIKPSADGKRLNNQAKEEYVEKSASEFFSELYEILTFKPTNVKGDVYVHTLSFFVGGIMQVPQLFFPLVSFIYAFFYLGAIYKILTLTKSHNWKKLGIAFLLTFIAWKTIHDMQTVRTWTGLWVMIYGVLGYLKSKNRGYILFLLIPPLFHFAFFIMAVPCWLVMTLGNKKRIFVIIFFASFLTQIVPQQWALQQFKKVPLGAKKVEGYFSGDDERSVKLNTGPVDKKKKQRFYTAYMDKNLNDYAVVLVAFLLIISSAYYRQMGENEAILFSIGLLTKAFANGFFFIFPLENRMDDVAGAFILGATAMFLLRSNPWQFRANLKNKIIHYGFWGVFIFISPLFLYKLAGFLGWASFFLVYFPFIPWLSEINFSIRDSILHFI